MTLDARFKVTKGIVKQSSTQTDTGTSATVKAVVGTKVYMQPREAAGKTFKFVTGGARGAGGNGAFTVALYCNGTAICTQTAAQNDAKDWYCEIICVNVNHKSQKSIGFIAQQGEESAANYQAGTVDTSAGATFEIKIGSGHGSDSLQAEVAYVEVWESSSITVTS